VSGARWVKLPSGARVDLSRVMSYGSDTDRVWLTLAGAGHDTNYSGENATALLAALDAYHFPAEAAGGETARIYPCADCGCMRTKDEGGTTFTVCDDCWDKAYKKPTPPASAYTGVLPDTSEFRDALDVLKMYVAERAKARECKGGTKDNPCIHDINVKRGEEWVLALYAKASAKGGERE